MANEDYTTYTKVDPNSKMTVTASKIDYTTMDVGDVAYVNKDKGVAHFNDFNHYIEVQVKSGASNNGDSVNAIAISNTSNYTSTNGASAHCSALAYDNASTCAFFANDDASNLGVSSLSFNTTYYLTFNCTGSTLTIYVYSDSGRTTLVGSNNISLSGTSNTTYRYIAFANKGKDPGTTTSAFVQNLNLNEVVANTSNFLAFM